MYKNYKSYITWVGTDEQKLLLSYTIKSKSEKLFFYYHLEIPHHFNLCI